MKWIERPIEWGVVVTLLLGCPGDDGATNETSTTAPASTSDSGVDGTMSAGEPGGCANPQPIMQNESSPTGFVQCADGTIMRVEPVTCDSPNHPGGCTAENGSCSSDAECTNGPRGACTTVFLGQGESCVCAYGCESDAECGEGSVCACGGIGVAGYPARSTCIPAPCQFDDDCGSERCRFSGHPTSCEANPRMACTSPQDECSSHDDCDSSPSDACVAFGAGPWECWSEDCG